MRNTTFICNHYYAQLLYSVLTYTLLLQKAIISNSVWQEDDWEDEIICFLLPRKSRDKTAVSQCWSCAEVVRFCGMVTKKQFTEDRLSVMERFLLHLLFPFSSMLFVSASWLFPSHHNRKTSYGISTRRTQTE